MKSRLAASIHLFTAGKCRINTRSTISSRSIFAVFDRHHGQIDCSSQTRGFESSNRAVHSSALEDDAFSELGPGESECSLKKITLVTEKLDDFVGDDASSELDILKCYAKKIKLVTEKHDAFLDDDVSSELDPGISECSAKKTKLVTEKHDAFLDDDVSSELDPGISECSAKKTKLVTKKPDTFLDDAFSELGPGISECSAKQIKLVTEKRDRVPKTQSHRRESASRPISSDYRPNAKELFEAIARASTTSSTKFDAPVHVPNAKKLFGAIAQPSTSLSTKLHSPSSTDHKELASRPLSSVYRSNANDLLGATTKASTASSTKLPSPVHAPASTDDAKKISEVEYPLSVSIKNIPSKVGLPELIEAISVFGKVSGASFVTKSDKSKCCNIEFEDADSSRRAILAGKVEVGSNVFLVNSLGAVDLVAVRIKNINEKTADSAIHSICKSVGELVGLTRKSKNGVDAFFYVRNHTSHPGIVKKLNKTVHDLNRWSAHVLTSISNSSEEPSDKDVGYKLQRQILNHFDQLKMELRLKEMNLQDLESLTASIMHIRDVPLVPYQSGNR